MIDVVLDSIAVMLLIVAFSLTIALMVILLSDRRIRSNDLSDRKKRIAEWRWARSIFSKLNKNKSKPTVATHTSASAQIEITEVLTTVHRK